MKISAAFFKHCSGFLGLDSGPAYLASWAGLDSIILMGATQSQTPDRKGPSVGPRTSNIHYIEAPKPDNPNCKPVPCYVHCLLNKMGGCIIDITPDLVWNKCKQIYKIQ